MFVGDSVCFESYYICIPFISIYKDFWWTKSNRTLWNLHEYLQEGALRSMKMSFWAFQISLQLKDSFLLVVEKLMISMIEWWVLLILSSKLVFNLMNELKNKLSQNLKATRTITGFNGLYGLHDNIFEKKYKGASDLIFWVNCSFDLHNIVNLPNSIEIFLQRGEERTFNFFEQFW